MDSNSLVYLLAAVALLLFLIEVAAFHTRISNTDVIFNIICAGGLVVFLVVGLFPLSGKILHALQSLFILIPIGFNLASMSKFQKDNKIAAKIWMALNVIEMLVLVYPFIKIVLML